MVLRTSEKTVWEVLDSGEAQYVVAPVSTDAVAPTTTRTEAALAAGAPHANIPKLRASERIHTLGALGTVTTLGGESTAADPSGLLPPRRDPRGGTAPTRGVLAVQWHQAADAPAFRPDIFRRAMERIENVWPRPRVLVFPSNAGLWGAGTAKFWKRVGAWSTRSGIDVVMASMPLPPPAPVAPPVAPPRVALLSMLNAQAVPRPKGLAVTAPPDAPPSPISGSPLAGGKRGPKPRGEDQEKVKRATILSGLREVEARARAAREASWAQEMVRAHLKLTVDDVVGLYGRVDEAERSRMRREVVQGSEEWLRLRRGGDVMGRVAAVLRKHVPAGAAPGSEGAAKGMAAAREAVLDVLAAGVPRLTSSKAYAVVFVAMNRAMEAARAAGRELGAPPFFAEEAARNASSAEREVREMLKEKLGGGKGFYGSRYTRWGTAHEEGGVAAYAEAARRGLVVGPRAARGTEFAILSSLSRDRSGAPEAEVVRVRDGAGIHVHPRHPFFAFSYDALFRIRPRGSEEWVVRHVEVKCPGNPYASLGPMHRVQIVSMLDGLRAEGLPVDGCDYVVHMPHGSTRVMRVPFVQAEADFIMKMLGEFLRREMAPLLIARWEGRLAPGSLAPTR